jgi:hypothetical protein
MLYKEIAVYVGIDIQNMFQNSQTFGQTAIQHEKSQKRIQTWLINRDMAYERLADLHKDNLQEFYPIAKAEEVITGR